MSFTRVVAFACAFAFAFACIIPHTRALDANDAFEDHRDTKFVVRVAPSPAFATPATPHRAYAMTASNGAKFSCVVPVARERTTSHDDGEESTEEENIDEHLAPLRGRCFYYADGGWWTYEVCHELRVEQFHREGMTRVNAYELGTFDRARSATLRMEKNHAAGERRYHAHAYANGATCADVGDAFAHVTRSSEVRFVCSEDGNEGVASVEEPATCRYVLTFRTPLACKANALRPRRPDVNVIECSPEVDGERDETSANEDESSRERASARGRMFDETSFSRARDEL